MDPEDAAVATLPLPGTPRPVPPLIAALLHPGAYPHQADDLRLHETHISWVVLAGAYAYKIKKPVTFGFLDLSTRERRAAACADEVRLNARLCPEVYLGVVNVVARAGGYAIGGSGEPVEPAVKMRRLPAAGMLPTLLGHGAVEARLLQRLARLLAQFHAAAATGPGIDEWGTAGAVRANWEENFAEMAPFVGVTVDRRLDATIRAFMGRFLADNGDLLARRVAAGRIRDGHGDLHAANICVEGRRLYLFDCLEFDPRYRCADVAAEVAFLAMDLARYGRADLAASFVESYVQASGDRDLPHLLDFYSCYRAYVRGKVLSLRLAELGLPPDERERLIAEARGCFTLAWAFAGGLGRPHLLVTIGLPASGKSSLARALAGQLNLTHLSSDLIRKELAGRHPTERRGEAFGEGIYTATMTRRTYAALRRRAAACLRLGHSVVLDATYGRVSERANLRRLAAKLGARFVAFYCRADDATLQARLAARDGDPGVVSDARLPMWPALRAAFSEPTELPNAHAIDMTTALDRATAAALRAIDPQLAPAPESGTARATPNTRVDRLAVTGR